MCRKKKLEKGEKNGFITQNCNFYENGKSRKNNQDQLGSFNKCVKSKQHKKPE